MAAVESGCRGERSGQASNAIPAAHPPRLIHQNDGREVLDLSATPIPGMTIAEVRSVETSSSLETNGLVAFDDRRVATIVARVAGRIEATRVSQWDYVRRGEPIVELYSPDFMTGEAEFLQAKMTSQLSAAAGQSAGAEILAASRRKLELLGLSAEDIARLQAPNPTTWMRAPISGMVVENKAVRGAQVSPGDVLFSLGSLDQVWIVADIYEDDLARIHSGQVLEATTTAYPGEIFHGAIARISPAIDPTTHTLQIRCAIENPGLKLKPQMLVRVKIATTPGFALIVPEEALVFDTNHYFVYVMAGPHRFVRRRVEPGSSSSQGWSNVTGALHADDRVVAAESLQVNALWHQANGEN